MCGGFACALGVDPAGKIATLYRHLLYNTGRVTSYMFMGGLAGMAGQSLILSDSMSSKLPTDIWHHHSTLANFVTILPETLSTGQRILAVFAGLLMLIMALQLFGYLQRLHILTTGLGSNTLVSSLRALLNSRSRSATLAFGVFNGFLPCPLVYAFIAYAAASANIFSGMITMASFGVGTFPAMILIGGLGQFINHHWRKRAVWVAGLFIMLLGLITILRGLFPLTGH
jgi:sulfite exporter TauE/SafE